MRDKVKWSKDKNFRETLEKQFLQKPNKILKVIFSATVSDPKNPDKTLEQVIDPHTTIYELVLKHNLPENVREYL